MAKETKKERAARLARLRKAANKKSVTGLATLGILAIPAIEIGLKAIEEKSVANVTPRLRRSYTAYDPRTDTMELGAAARTYLPAGIPLAVMTAGKLLFGVRRIGGLFRGTPFRS